MYSVYCDEYLLYSPSVIDDYRISNAMLSEELNKIGSFVFTIYPNHKNYDKIKKLKSIITVYEDGKTIFRGRVLEDQIGFYNDRKITCESDLSFLIDSIQRPFEFPQDSEHATPADYFNFLISRHNEQVPENKRFVIGLCTVTDANNYISRSDSEYSTTLDLINEGLLNTVGGYLWLDSDDSGNRRINYLSNFSTVGTQPIEFGLNLIDLLLDRNGEDIATAILPLGATNDETDETLTISDIPDETTSDICKESDIVYSKSAETLYGGRITKVVRWDDVTEATNLLRKAKEYLQKAILQPNTITLKSADISKAGYNVDPFYIGTRIVARSEKHNLNDTYLVNAISIDLFNPANNTISVGSISYGFTEQNNRDLSEAIQRVEKNIEINKQEVLRETTRQASSLISQESDNIKSYVGENYYTKDEANIKVAEVSTELEQTKESINITFTNIGNDIDEIHKYIRFVDGNIILENGDNKQVITATQNEFRESGVMVAYISGKRFMINEGEIVNSLYLGKFAFVPRNNGNLSLKKMVN